MIIKLNQGGLNASIKGVLYMRRILVKLIGLNLEKGKEVLNKEINIIKEYVSIQGSLKQYMFYVNNDDYIIYTTEVSKEGEDKGLGYWSIL